MPEVIYTAAGELAPPISPANIRRMTRQEVIDDLLGNRTLFAGVGDDGRCVGFRSIANTKDWNMICLPLYSNDGEKEIGDFTANLPKIGLIIVERAPGYPEEDIAILLD